ncbi:hypothetical protein [Streptomyces sp. LBL]|uniref:hypothetical protein n=1 Tax=Streptomyces sp. LBL TaxID=2940562 RepID=UPI00247550BD|nr:hypothetical protein [Streptomyces sp. LBL]
MQQFRLLLARGNAEVAHSVFLEALASLVAYELELRIALLDPAGNNVVLGPGHGPVVPCDVHALHPVKSS